jgi:hypothetical protein
MASSRYTKINPTATSRIVEPKSPFIASFFLASRYYIKTQLLKGPATPINAGLLTAPLNRTLCLLNIQNGNCRLVPLESQYISWRIGFTVRFS